MRETELLKAKSRYNRLVRDNEKLEKVRDIFVELLEDSSVQEYLAIKDWVYFENRVLELEQLDIIKKYLHLEEKYGSFKELTDYDLVEAAFDKGIDMDNASNIYVYMGAYKIINSETQVETKNIANADYFLYRNLETTINKIVFKYKLPKFKADNRIIVFKNKRYEPDEMFYKYRVMYLRQLLLDNPTNLYPKKRLTK